MKIICDRAVLAAAVQLAQQVVATRAAVPALSCIKLSATQGRLSLQAADKDIAVEVPVVAVEVKEIGEALVPAKKLAEVINECEGATVSLETAKQALHIKADRMKFSILGFDPKEFPAPKDPGAKAEFSVTAETLRRLVSRSVFAAATENTRFAMGGVFMERKGKRLRLVATDGRRLVVTRGDCTAANEGDTVAIVPTKAMTLLNRLASQPDDAVQVARVEGRLIIRVGEGPEAASLHTNLIEGTFPPFEDVIPKEHDRKVTCDVQQLLASVRRAGILTTEQSKGVKMGFAGTELKISGSSPDVGEAEISMPLEGYQGQPIDIIFNPHYLVEALRIVDSPDITVELKAPNKPGVFRVGQEFVYVIMPTGQA
jgi:DNA polymerase-3 subunit beta